MFICEWETPIWPPSIQMGETAGIFLASILLRDAPSSVYKISMILTNRPLNIILQGVPKKTLVIEIEISHILFNLTEKLYEFNRIWVI